MRRIAGAVLSAMLMSLAVPVHATAPQLVSRVQRLGPGVVLLTFGPAAGRAPAVLYVHGGAWRRGLVAPRELGLARQLAERTGWNVGVVDYPTRQPRRFREPAAVALALRALVRAPHVDQAKVAMWGESAGGQLGLLDAYRIAASSGVRVCAVASISGPTDLSTAFASAGELLLHAIDRFEEATPADHEDRYVATSPTTFVSARTPPTFQAGAASDWLVPLSQLTELDDALARAGIQHELVIVPGPGHARSIEAARTDNNMTVEQRATAFVRAAFGTC